jgi:hypothetical protein
MPRGNRGGGLFEQGPSLDAVAQLVDMQHCGKMFESQPGRKPLMGTNPERLSGL